MNEAAKVRKKIDYEVSISTLTDNKVRKSSGTIIYYSGKYENRVSSNTKWRVPIVLLCKTGHGDQTEFP